MTVMNQQPKVSHIIRHGTLTFAFLFGCGFVTRAFSQEPPSEFVPAFVETSCSIPDDIPMRQRFRCGTVAVPAKPMDPSGGAYRLRVAIIASARQPARPDAIVVLSGGPGGSLIPRAPTTGGQSRLALPSASPQVNPVSGRAPPWVAFAGERDVVMIDPRGVGESEPHVCGGAAGSATVDLFGPRRTRTELIKVFRDRWRECLEEARARGLSPEGFGSIVDADDVERVRTALGYAPWTAIAPSYGAMTAFSLVSRHPEGLRALVLESAALGPLSRLTRAQGWRRAWYTLLASCTGDPVCAQEYPNLDDDLNAALERLERAPLAVPIPGGLLPDVDTVQLDSGDFDVLIFRALYVKDEAAAVPALIRAVNEDRGEAWTTTVVRALTGYGGQSSFVEAMTLCRDATAEMRAAVLPTGAWEMDLAEVAGFCPDWIPSTPAPLVPEGSSTPALVLAGALDPTTPPANGRWAAAAIGAAARYVEIPSVGHGTLRQSPCARQIIADFIVDPAATLDTSCVTNEPPIDFTVEGD